MMRLPVLDAPPWCYQRWAYTVLRLSPSLAQRLWRVLSADESAIATTICYAAGRCERATDYTNAIAQFLQTATPHVTVLLVEHYVTTKALTRHEGTVIQEAILAQTGPRGYWK